MSHGTFASYTHGCRCLKCRIADTNHQALVEELDAYNNAEARDEWPEIAAAAKAYLALVDGETA